MAIEGNKPVNLISIPPIYTGVKKPGDAEVKATPSSKPAAAPTPKAPEYLDIKTMQEIHRLNQMHSKMSPEIFDKFAKLPDTIQFVFVKDTDKGSA